MHSKSHLSYVAHLIPSLDPPTTIGWISNTDQTMMTQAQPTYTIHPCSQVTTKPKSLFSNSLTPHLSVFYMAFPIFHPNYFWQQYSSFPCWWEYLNFGMLCVIPQPSFFHSNSSVESDMGSKRLNESLSPYHQLLVDWCGSIYGLRIYIHGWTRFLFSTEAVARIWKGALSSNLDIPLKKDKWDSLDLTCHYCAWFECFIPFHYSSI